MRRATPLASGTDGVLIADDVYGARLDFEAGAAPRLAAGAAGAALEWRGHAAIRAWARQLFALRHRSEASGFALVVGTGGAREPGRGGERDAGVVWRYRAHVDFFRQMPGVPPGEGTATATVRGGALTALALDGDPDARARRDDGVRAALAAAGERAVLAQGSPPVSEAAAPAPPAVALQPPVWGDAAWPLAVAGLGAGAYALRRARRRARAGAR